MNNEWYDNPVNPSVAAGQQNQTDAQVPISAAQPKPKKTRRQIPVAVFVACMLVVALACGSLGGYLVYSNIPKDTLPASGPAYETGNAGEAKGPNPSDGIRLSNNTAPQTDDQSNIIARAMSSIVGIDISQTGRNYWGMATVNTGSGSGVIITSDGYIATNNHAVEGANEIKVYLQDGTEYKATYIGADSRTDLAVIKIDASGLIPATVGRSSELKVGDQVFAIGNPLGELMSTVTSGIISGLDRSIVIDGNEMTLLQTDAAVNPGNSGGGLFNARGELIGIVNAKSTGFEVEGLGFAIPSDLAINVLRDLMDLGYVSGRPYVGISTRDVYLAASNAIDPFGMRQPQYVIRVMIAKVEPNTAAERAGLKVNDIILAVDDVDVQNAAHLTSLIGEYKVGDSVTLSIQRGSEILQVVVTLGERTGAN